MKSIKNIVAALALVAFLSVSTFADGILVTGRDGQAGSEPCSQNTTADKDGILVTGFTGILVTGFTGILVTGFTGILVTGATEDPNETCGILVTG